jgi:hypothetical protein
LGDASSDGSSGPPLWDGGLPRLPLISSKKFRILARKAAMNLGSASPNTAVREYVKASSASPHPITAMGFGRFALIDRTSKKTYVLASCR